MNTLLPAVAASFAAVALACSVVSLALHWVRRKEHPDVSELRAIVSEMRTEHLDLYDRVEHWIKRDRVRKLREGRENAQAAQEAAAPANGDYKAALRARVRNAGLTGIAQR